MLQRGKNWSTKRFIWAATGSAVGFANVLSFSAKAYHYGGGAFLIPSMIAMLIISIPLLFLEGVIGQYFNLPITSAFKKVNNRYGPILGWLPVFAVTTIGGYYMLLTAWTIAYGYFTATDAIPIDTTTFLNTHLLKKTSHIAEFGGFSWILFICMIIVGVFSWTIVSQRIQPYIEKACGIFLPTIAITIVACAVMVAFLPGAWYGIERYLYPDTSVLIQPKLWLDIFGHIFFSLSLGLGIINGYSLQIQNSMDVKRSMMIVVLGDFIISITSGFVIFGYIGYMSSLSGIPFSQLIISASPFEMGFIIFPIIFKMFGPFLYRIIGPFFFFNIFIAGLIGIFTLIEACAGNIKSEFKVSRIKAITIATTAMVICATIFCYGNGQHIMGAVDPMVLGFNMLISGLSEIIFFLWVDKAVSNHPIWFSFAGKRTHFYRVLKYALPLILSTVLISSIIEEFYSGLGWAGIIRWSWFIIAVLLATTFARRAHQAEQHEKKDTSGLKQHSQSSLQ